MSRLNYSKWDNLELSDDSDVEVHPNVDKKSFIRWKQRDIHEKRDMKKQQLAAYQKELEINGSLQPMLQQIVASTESEGHLFFSREVSRLRTDRAERGNKDGPDGPTPNDMILSLLLQIEQDSDVHGKTGQPLDEALLAKLKEHQTKLAARTEELKTEIAKIEAEEKKKITSDGLKEGFSRGYVAPAEKEEEEEKAKAKAKSQQKSKAKETTTSIETLNTPASTSSQPTAADSDADDDDDDDDDEEVPDLTPMKKAFGLLPPCIPPSVPLSASQLPPTFIPAKHLNGAPFSSALDFLASHKQLLRKDADAHDAMLVEAFQSQMRGEEKRARQFVEKALMIQYLEKLGPDGVNLFFRRMASPDGKAVTVFFNDVLSTYGRIAGRCVELQKEGSGGSGAGSGQGEPQEQIQLVAEDPSTVISFEIPEGPAPEHLEIDVEGARAQGHGEEDAPAMPSVEEIRTYLDKRWEIFNSFPVNLQEALRSKSLDRVNSVLGKMDVSEAEQVVGLLDSAGILSFASSEVRDETGK